MGSLGSTHGPRPPAVAATVCRSRPRLVDRAHTGSGSWNERTTSERSRQEAGGLCPEVPTAPAANEADRPFPGAALLLRCLPPELKSGFCRSVILEIFPHPSFIAFSHSVQESFILGEYI